MSENVFILGNCGNMGQRYTAVLKYLNFKHWGIDQSFHKGFIDDLLKATHIIIATPTHLHSSHIDMMRTLIGNEIPILCEKPITKDTSELKYINDRYKNIYMVNNYKFILPQNSKVLTYDYFKTGGDSLSWDCIQLFDFVDDISNIHIHNQSPIWKMTVDKIDVLHSNIDYSYILMMQSFINNETNRLWDLNKAIELNKKVDLYAELHNRDTSEIDVDTAAEKDTFTD